MFSDFAGNPDLAKNGLAYILPSYKAYAYARRVIETFFATTPEGLNPVILHFDDASPTYLDQNWAAFYGGLPVHRIWHTYYDRNGGLTRSWNAGLELARKLGCKYAITGNNDVLFAPHWYEGLIWHLDNNSARLVGPLTNAPGHTGGDGSRQNVVTYLPSFVPSDDPTVLANYSAMLKEAYPISDIRLGAINGFFMMSRLDYWWEGAYNTKVFNPGPKFRMTGNEDELEKRWICKTYKIGVVPSSLVIHYRSVSRGDRYRSPGSFRMQR